MGSALRAASEGMSASAWMRALTEAGTGIRRQVGFRLYGQAKALAAEYGSEPSRPLNQVPAGPEVRSWPTRASEGVLQSVQVFYRERVTGRIVQKFYNVKTPNGITRQEAIDKAISAYASNAEDYEQDLIEAVHTGTALLVPEAVA